MATTAADAEADDAKKQVQDDAAVGSISHILRTLFRGLYEESEAPDDDAEAGDLAQALREALAPVRAAALAEVRLGRREGLHGDDDGPVLGPQLAHVLRDGHARALRAHLRVLEPLRLLFPSVAALVEVRALAVDRDADAAVGCLLYTSPSPRDRG